MEMSGFLSFLSSAPFWRLNKSRKRNQDTPPPPPPQTVYKILLAGGICQLLSSDEMTNLNSEGLILHLQQPLVKAGTR